MSIGSVFLLKGFNVCGKRGAYREKWSLKAVLAMIALAISNVLIAESTDAQTLQIVDATHLVCAGAEETVHQGQTIYLEGQAKTVASIQSFLLADNDCKTIVLAQAEPPHQSKEKRIDATTPKSKPSILERPTLSIVGTFPDSSAIYAFNSTEGNWNELPTSQGSVDDQVLHQAALGDAHSKFFVGVLDNLPDSPTPTPEANFKTIQEITSTVDAKMGLPEFLAPSSTGNGALNLDLRIEYRDAHNGPPTMGVSYSSRNGQSWMGPGWSLNTSKITVGTSEGTPVYSTERETEEYFVDGQRLRPVSNGVAEDLLFRQSAAAPIKGVGCTTGGNRKTTAGITEFALDKSPHKSNYFRIGCHPETYSWIAWHGEQRQFSYYGISHDLVKDDLSKQISFGSPLNISKLLDPDPNALQRQKSSSGNIAAWGLTARHGLTKFRLAELHHYAKRSGDEAIRIDHIEYNVALLDDLPDKYSKFQEHGRSLIKFHYTGRQPQYNQANIAYGFPVFYRHWLTAIDVVAYNGDDNFIVDGVEGSHSLYRRYRFLYSGSKDSGDPDLQFPSLTETSCGDTSPPELETAEKLSNSYLSDIGFGKFVNQYAQRHLREIWVQTPSKLNASKAKPTYSLESGVCKYSDMSQRFWLPYHGDDTVHSNELSSVWPVARKVKQKLDKSSDGSIITEGILGLAARPTATGSTTCTETSLSAYIGFGFPPIPGKPITFGPKLGGSLGECFSNSMILDINNDSIEDVVIEKDGKVSYYPGIRTPEGHWEIEQIAYPALNVSDLSRTDTESLSFSVDANVYVVLGAGLSKTKSIHRVAFLHADRDGCIDHVRGGMVFYSQCETIQDDGTRFVNFLPRKPLLPLQPANSVANTAVESLAPIAKDSLEQVSMIGKSDMRSQSLHYTATVPVKGQYRLNIAAYFSGSQIALLEETQDKLEEIRSYLSLAKIKFGTFKDKSLGDALAQKACDSDATCEQLFSNIPNLVSLEPVVTIRVHSNGTHSVFSCSLLDSQTCDIDLGDINAGAIIEIELSNGSKAFSKNIAYNLSLTSISENQQSDLKSTKGVAESVKSSPIFGIDWKTCQTEGILCHTFRLGDDLQHLETTSDYFTVGPLDSAHLRGSYLIPSNLLEVLKRNSDLELSLVVHAKPFAPENEHPHLKLVEDIYTFPTNSSDKTFTIDENILFDECSQLEAKQLPRSQLQLKAQWTVTRNKRSWTPDIYTDNILKLIDSILPIEPLQVEYTKPWLADRTAFLEKSLAGSTSFQPTDKPQENETLAKSKLKLRCAGDSADNDPAAELHFTQSFPVSKPHVQPQSNLLIALPKRAVDGDSNWDMKPLPGGKRLTQNHTDNINSNEIVTLQIAGLQKAMLECGWFKANFPVVPLRFKDFCESVLSIKSDTQLGSLGTLREIIARPTKISERIELYESLNMTTIAADITKAIDVVAPDGEIVENPPSGKNYADVDHAELRLALMDARSISEDTDNFDQNLSNLETEEIEQAIRQVFDKYSILASSRLLEARRKAFKENELDPVALANIYFDINKDLTQLGYQLPSQSSPFGCAGIIEFIAFIVENRADDFWNIRNDDCRFSFSAEYLTQRLNTDTLFGAGKALKAGYEIQVRLRKNGIPVDFELLDLKQTQLGWPNEKQFKCPRSDLGEIYGDGVTDFLCGPASLMQFGSETEGVFLNKVKHRILSAHSRAGIPKNNFKSSLSAMTWIEKSAMRRFKNSLGLLFISKKVSSAKYEVGADGKVPPDANIYTFTALPGDVVNFDIFLKPKKTIVRTSTPTGQPLSFFATAIQEQTSTGTRLTLPLSTRGYLEVEGLASDWFQLEEPMQQEFTKAFQASLLLSAPYRTFSDFFQNVTKNEKFDVKNRRDLLRLSPQLMVAPDTHFRKTDNTNIVQPIEIDGERISSIDLEELQKTKSDMEKQLKIVCDSVSEKLDEETKKNARKKCSAEGEIKKQLFQQYAALYHSPPRALLQKYQSLSSSSDERTLLGATETNSTSLLERLPDTKPDENLINALKNASNPTPDKFDSLFASIKSTQRVDRTLEPLVFAPIPRDSSKGDFVEQEYTSGGNSLPAIEIPFCDRQLPATPSLNASKSFKTKSCWTGKDSGFFVQHNSDNTFSLQTGLTEAESPEFRKALRELDSLRTTFCAMEDVLDLEDVEKDEDNRAENLLAHCETLLTPSNTSTGVRPAVAQTEDGKLLPIKFVHLQRSESITISVNAGSDYGGASYQWATEKPIQESSDFNGNGFVETVKNNSTFELTSPAGVPSSVWQGNAIVAQLGRRESKFQGYDISAAVSLRKTYGTPAGSNNEEKNEKNQSVPNNSSTKATNAGAETEEGAFSAGITLGFGHYSADNIDELFHYDGDGRIDYLRMKSAFECNYSNDQVSVKLLPGATLERGTGHGFTSRTNATQGQFGFKVPASSPLAVFCKGGEEIALDEQTKEPTGLSLGFSIAGGSFTGGIGLSKSTSNTKAGLMDFGGGPELDMVVPLGGSNFAIFPGVGSGFGPPRIISVTGLNRESTTSNEGVTADIGFGGTGTVTLPFGLKIAIGITSKHSTSLSRQLLQVRDMQGDGCPDIITASGMFSSPNGDFDANFAGSDDSKSVEVYRNPDCKIGLLKGFTNPSGEHVEVDYELSNPNTQQDGKTRWNLTSVKRFDGYEPIIDSTKPNQLPSDGIDIVKNRFSYRGGNYSKLFREFYGYGNIVTSTGGFDCAETDATCTVRDNTVIAKSSEPDAPIALTLTTNKEVIRNDQTVYANHGPYFSGQSKHSLIWDGTKTKIYQRVLFGNESQTIDEMTGSISDPLNISLNSVNAEKPELKIQTRKILAESNENLGKAGNDIIRGNPWNNFQPKEITLSGQLAATWGSDGVIHEDGDVDSLPWEKSTPTLSSSLIVRDSAGRLKHAIEPQKFDKYDETSAAALVSTIRQPAADSRAYLTISLQANGELVNALSPFDVPVETDVFNITGKNIKLERRSAFDYTTALNLSTDDKDGDLRVARSCRALITKGEAVDPREITRDTLKSGWCSQFLQEVKNQGSLVDAKNHIKGEWATNGQFDITLDDIILSQIPEVDGFGNILHTVSPPDSPNVKNWLEKRYDYSNDVFARTPTTEQSLHCRDGSNPDSNSSIVLGSVEAAEHCQFAKLVRGKRGKRVVKLEAKQTTSPYNGNIDFIQDVNGLRVGVKYDHLNRLIAVFDDFKEGAGDSVSQQFEALAVPTLHENWAEPQLRVAIEYGPTRNGRSYNQYQLSTHYTLPSGALPSGKLHSTTLDGTGKLIQSRSVADICNINTESANDSGLFPTEQQDSNIKDACKSEGGITNLVVQSGDAVDALGRPTKSFQAFAGFLSKTQDLSTNVQYDPALQEFEYHQLAASLKTTRYDPLSRITETRNPWKDRGLSNLEKTPVGEDIKIKTSLNSFVQDVLSADGCTSTATVFDFRGLPIELSEEITGNAADGIDNFHTVSPKDAAQLSSNEHILPCVKQDPDEGSDTERKAQYHFDPLRQLTQVDQIGSDGKSEYTAFTRYDSVGRRIQVADNARGLHHYHWNGFDALQRFDQYGSFTIDELTDKISEDTSANGHRRMLAQYFGQRETKHTYYSRLEISNAEFTDEDIEDAVEYWYDGPFGSNFVPTIVSNNKEKNNENGSEKLKNRFDAFFDAFGCQNCVGRATGIKNATAVEAYDFDNHSNQNQKLVSILQLVEEKYNTKNLPTEFANYRETKLFTALGDMKNVTFEERKPLSKFDNCGSDCWLNKAVFTYRYDPGGEQNFLNVVGKNAAPIVSSQSFYDVHRRPVLSVASNNVYSIHDFDNATLLPKRQLQVWVADRGLKRKTLNDNSLTFDTLSRPVASLTLGDAAQHDNQSVWTELKLTHYDSLSRLTNLTHINDISDTLPSVNFNSLQTDTYTYVYDSLDRFKTREWDGSEAGQRDPPSSLKWKYIPPTQQNANSHLPTQVDIGNQKVEISETWFGELENLKITDSGSFVQHTDYRWSAKGELSTATITDKENSSRQTSNFYDTAGNRRIRAILDPDHNVLLRDTETGQLNAQTNLYLTPYFARTGSGSGRLQTEVPGIGGVSSSIDGQDIRFTLVDTTGSVIGIFNKVANNSDAGPSVAREVHTPFGIQRKIADTYGSNTGTPKFNVYHGKASDPGTGLRYFGARHYDPLLGIWASPDPLLSSYLAGSPNLGVFSAANLNPYSYSANNPYMYSDSGGQAWGLAAKVIKIAIKGGDIASTVSGIVEDYKVVTSSTASTGNRLFAAASIISEVVSPVSVRDAKVLKKMADHSDTLIDQAKRTKNISTDTVSVTSREALRKAKAKNGIPRSTQPDKTFKPNTKEGEALGLDDRNVKLYEYTNNTGQKVHIRQDKAVTYKDGGKQQKHFNAGKAGEKLKQHHYYGE